MDRGPSVIIPKFVGNTQGDPGHDELVSPQDKAERYKEVFACLGQFQQLLTEGTALSFEREKAKKSWVVKEEEYGRFASHHTNFPPILEQQEKSRLKARRIFEEADKKFTEKMMEMTKIKDRLAIRIISGGVDANAINQELQTTRDKLEVVEKLVETESSEIVNAKDNVSTLDRTVNRECESLRRELSSVRDELAMLKAASASDEARKSQFEQEKNSISIFASQLDGQIAKMREEMSNASKGIQGLLGESVHRLEQKFDLLDREVKKDHSQLEQAHKLLDAHGQRLDTLNKSRQQDVQAVKTIDTNMTQLSVRLKALELNPLPSVLQSQAEVSRSLEDDVVQFKKRVEKLESRPYATPLQSSSERAAIDDNTHKILEGFISKIKIIENSFEQLQDNISQRFVLFEKDNDEIYGQSIDTIQSQVSNLEAKVPSLKSGLDHLVTVTSTTKDNLEALRDRLNSDIKRIEDNQTTQSSEHGGLLGEHGRFLVDLQKEVQVLKAPARTTEGSSNHGPNPTALVRQTSSPVMSNVAPIGRQLGSPIVNSADQFSVKQIAMKVDAFGIKLDALSNELEGVKMGTMGLNARFNNLTTEGMVRHMLSQLELVYPHLKDATREVAKLVQNVQALYPRIDALEQRNHTLPAGLKESLEKFDENLTALGHRAEEVEENVRLLQAQMDQVHGGSVATDRANGDDDKSFALPRD